MLPSALVASVAFLAPAGDALLAFPPRGLRGRPPPFPLAAVRLGQRVSRGPAWWLAPCQRDRSWRASPPCPPLLAAVEPDDPESGREDEEPGNDSGAATTFGGGPADGGETQGGGEGLPISEVDMPRKGEPPASADVGGGRRQKESAEEWPARFYLPTTEKDPAGWEESYMKERLRERLRPRPPPPAAGGQQGEGPGPESGDRFVPIMVGVASLGYLAIISWEWVRLTFFSD